MTKARADRSSPAADRSGDRRNGSRQVPPRYGIDLADTPGGLPAGLRAGLEALSGVDLSAVRVHRNSGEPARLHADAYTRGSDIYLTPGGERHLPHEGWHAVQQLQGRVPVTTTVQGAGTNTSPALEAEADAMGERAARTTPATATVRAARSVPTGVVQRHASFEHYLLGEVNPAELRSIADARLDVVRQRVTGTLRLGDASTEVQVSVRHARHVLTEERQKLRAWQQQPPRGIEDPRFQSRLVSIPSLGGSTICTYGELNMLADYFGSVDELQGARAETVRGVLQTERDENYERIGEILGELALTDYVVKEEMTRDPNTGESFPVQVRYYLPEGAPHRTEYEPADYTVREGSSILTGQRFPGSQRWPVASLNTPTFGGLEALPGVSRGLMPQDPGLAPTGSAWGVVARNACHFAPESWRTWESYHRDALGLAAQAAAAQGEASQRLANEARLNNGFGDHYLQDSFASGHLINKTLVMQWYMEDIANWWTGPSAEEWRRLSQMREGRQPGLAPADYRQVPGVPARNPQAAADQPTPAGSWQVAGLREVALSDPARTLFTAMRMTRSAAARSAAEWFAATSGTSLTGGARLPTDADEAERALAELVAAGLALESWRMAPNLRLHVATYRLHPHDVPTGPAVTDDPSRAVRTATANIYHEWLQNSLIQAGSGALHDHFCKQGLWVATGPSGGLFKIYGDYKLLSAGAGPGVEKAAETARISQQNVEDVISGRKTQQEGLATVATVLGRFPSHVIPDFRDPVAVKGATDYGLREFTPPTGTPLRLDRWHDELEGYMRGRYLTRLFDTWSRWIVTQVADELVEFEQVSPHAGEEF